MSVKVNDMEWADMERLVTSRLNRLAMCKRGAVETDINGMQAKLGKRPAWTKEEVKANRVAVAAATQTACKITLDQAKKLEGHEITDLIHNRLKKVAEKFKEHPACAKWDKDQQALRKQREERIAQLDGDFQDVSDMFRLGIKNLAEFPAECEKLEAMVW